MKKITNCRLCSACCPVEVNIEQGEITGAKRITPFEKTISCLKLVNVRKIIYSKQRLQKPLLREKLNEDFKEVSWQEVLSFIAYKMNKIKEEYGASSVALLRGMAADWGTSWDYAVRLMSAFGSPNAVGNGSVCFVAREMAHNYTYGAITIPQVKDSKCIIIWGKNDRNTLPQMAEAIIFAKERGAKLIVVDPVKTFFTEMADIWIRIKPAHDGLLAMAIINEIIKKRLYDRDFVDNYCIGFEALRDIASFYDAEKVAEQIWVDADLIKETAKIYATTKPACIIDGNGVDMQLNIFDATRAICILRAITGNIDIPGGDFIPQPIPIRNIQLKEKISDIKSVMYKYPLFEKFHPTWGLHGQSTLIDAIIDEDPYPVKMLLVQSANPAVTMMDSQRVKKALQKLECLVMIDMFLNKTSNYAHVILPASSCFEKTQINRAYIRNCFIMLQQKVIEPIGESKPDIEIIFELAKALGLKEYFPWDTVEDALDFQLEPTGLKVEDLKNNPQGIWYEKPRFKKFEQEGFKTPSKKVEIYSERLYESGFDPVPFMRGIHGQTISFEKEGYDFIGISGERVSCFTHTQFRHVDELRNIEREPFVDINLQDAQKLVLKEQDLVEITTPRGKVTMKIKISDVVPEGIVRIAWGWGEVDDKWNLNNLTDDLERNPVTCTPSGRSFYCKIKKLKF
ncbi:MAG: molybdopterin-dependent oxidoreductase [Thermodesulfovibrio sp.]|nr:molybdopterin-dependent oxidoreductase [Thermodesulfovibrio sp.]